MKGIVFAVVLFGLFLAGCATTSIGKTITISVNGTQINGDVLVIPVQFENTGAESTTFVVTGTSLVFSDGTQEDRSNGPGCFYGFGAYYPGDYNSIEGEQIFPNAKKTFNICFSKPQDIKSKNATLYVKILYGYHYEGLTRAGGTEQEEHFDLTPYPD